MKCINCDGTGQVADYGAFSMGDFNGPKECPECGGSGIHRRARKITKKDLVSAMKHESEWEN